MPCLCTLYSNAIILIGAHVFSPTSFKHSFDLLHMFCVPHIYGGVRIPCCAHCIQMQNFNLCTYLGDLPHFI